MKAQQMEVDVLVHIPELLALFDDPTAQLPFTWERRIDYDDANLVRYDILGQERDSQIIVFNFEKCEPEDGHMISLVHGLTKRLNEVVRLFIAQHAEVKEHEAS